MGSSAASPKQKVTYYSAGWHMVPCLSAEEIHVYHMAVNDVEVFDGDAINTVDIVVNKENALGGASKEGGVIGTFSVLDGNPAQLAHGYLTSVLGDVPAYRGVVSIIANRPYLQANNPYLFPWKFKLGCFHSTWYAEKRAMTTVVTVYTTVAAEPPDNLDEDPDTASCTYNKYTAGECSIAGYPEPYTFENGAWVDDSASWICVDADDPGFDLFDECYDYKFVGEGTAAPLGTVTVESEETIVIGMNPIHVVRETLTDESWGRGLNTSLMDDEGLLAAADTVFYEGLAISIAWDKQSSVVDFLQVLMDHVGGVLTRTHNTGLYTVRLIRDGQPSSLSIPASSVISFDEYEEKGWAGTANEMTVKYTDIADGKTKSVTVHDLAAIERQGEVISETRDYPGAPTLQIALKLANRDLAMLTSQGSKILVTVDRIAYNLIPGDNFDITWPEYGLNAALFRVVDIDYGTQSSNQIQISAISDAQVSVLFQNSATIGANPPPAPALTYPLNANPRSLYEAPYWHVAQSVATTGFPDVFDDSDSFLIALGGKPQATASRFETSFQRNAELIESGGTGTWSGSLLTLFALNEHETDIILDRTYYRSAEKFVSGTLAIMGRKEIVEIVSFNLSTWNLSVNRGMLDTVPIEHAGSVLINTLGYADVGYSYESWFPGDSAKAWIRTVSSSGPLLLEEASEIALNVAGSRQGRPLPPGGVLVNGEYLGVVFTGALEITWAGRNRLTQTTDSHVTQSDPNVIPEDGTTYRIDIYGDDNTVLRSETIYPGVFSDPSDALDVYEHDDASVVSGSWPKLLETGTTNTHTGAGFSTKDVYSSVSETKLSGSFRFAGSRYFVYPTYLGLAPDGFTREGYYGSPNDIIGAGFGNNAESEFRQYGIQTGVGGFVGTAVTQTLIADTTYQFEVVFDWVSNTVSMTLGGVAVVSDAPIPAAYQAIKSGYKVVVHFPNYNSAGTVVISDIILTSDGVEQFNYPSPGDADDYYYKTSYLYDTDTEIADTGTGKLNAKLRFVLATERDGYRSWTSWDHTCFRAASSGTVNLQNHNFATGNLDPWEVVYGDPIARPIIGMPFSGSDECGSSGYLLGNREENTAGSWSVSQILNIGDYTSSEGIANGLTVFKVELSHRAITYGSIGEVRIDYFDTGQSYLSSEVSPHFYFQVGVWGKMEMYSNNPPGAVFAKVVITELSGTAGVPNDGYVGCINMRVYGRLGESVPITSANLEAAVSTNLDNRPVRTTSIAASAVVDTDLGGRPVRTTSLAISAVVKLP